MTDHKAEGIRPGKLVAIHNPDVTRSSRLEYLRGEIEAERISMAECIELEGLAEYIDPGDVLLLQWAGVPEFPESFCPACGQAIDYCPGHGEIGDPIGFMTLRLHDNGDHNYCHMDGCDEA